MYGGIYLRSEPRADELFNLSCVDGTINFDGGRYEGSSDGHHYKRNYLFKFVKNADGILTIKATYHTEDERFFFISDKNKVTQTTRFLPVPEK
jgi:hypothetical protein